MNELKKHSFYLWKTILLCGVFLMVSGCASMFIGGGSLVSSGYRPIKWLIHYRAEGTVPTGVEYWLVQTVTGEAIFERSFDGSGTLFQTRWRDNMGDHYATWVKSSHAYEIIVPLDRSQPAYRYVYPAGFYYIQTIGGITRPVPTTPIDPVATLYPIY